MKKLKDMTKTEQKVFDYSQSVAWDELKIRLYIVNQLNDVEYMSLPVDYEIGTSSTFIKKFKPTWI